MFRPLPNPFKTITACSRDTSWTNGTTAIENPVNIEARKIVKELPHRLISQTTPSEATADEARASVVIIPKSAFDAPIWVAYTGTKPNRPAQLVNCVRMARKEAMSKRGHVATAEK